MISLTNFKRFFPWKQKSYEGTLPDIRFIFLRNSGCVCVQHFTKQALLLSKGSQEIISFVYQLRWARNGAGFARRSEEVAMLQGKPWTIIHRERGKMDGQGSTQNGPSCRSWKEWNTPERDSGQSIGKNRVSWRVLVNALYSPRGDKG